MATSTKSESAQPRKCFPCSLDHNYSKADAFCIECNEFLCNACHKAHTKFKLTRLHKVLVGKDVPSDVSIFERIAAINHCSVHPEQTIQFKCINHNEFVCSICATTNHRGNDTLVALDKLELNGKDELKIQVERLASLKENAKQILSARLEQAESKKRQSVSLQEPLRCLTANIKCVLQYLEKEIITKLNTKFDSEIAAETGDIHEYIGIIDALHVVSVFAKTLLKYGSKEQIIIYNTKLLAHNERTEQHLSTLRKDSTDMQQKWGFESDMIKLKGNMWQIIQSTAECIRAFQTKTQFVDTAPFERLTNKRETQVSDTDKAVCAWYKHGKETNIASGRYVEMSSELLNNLEVVFDIHTRTKVFTNKCEGTPAIVKQDKYACTPSAAYKQKHKGNQTNPTPIKVMKHACMGTIDISKTHKCIQTDAPKSDNFDKCIQTGSPKSHNFDKCIQTDAPKSDNYDKCIQTEGVEPENSDHIKRNCPNAESNRPPEEYEDLYLQVGNAVCEPSIRKQQILQKDSNIDKKEGRAVKQKPDSFVAGRFSPTISPLRHSDIRENQLEQFIVDLTDYCDHGNLKSLFQTDEIIMFIIVMTFLSIECTVNPTLLEEVLSTVFLCICGVFIALVLLVYVKPDYLLNWRGYRRIQVPHWIRGAISK